MTDDDIVFKQIENGDYCTHCESKVEDGSCLCGLTKTPDAMKDVIGKPESTSNTGDEERGAKLSEEYRGLSGSEIIDKVHEDTAVDSDGSSEPPTDLPTGDSAAASEHDLEPAAILPKCTECDEVHVDYGMLLLHLEEEHPEKDEEYEAEEPLYAASDILNRIDQVMDECQEENELRAFRKLGKLRAMFAEFDGEVADQ